MYDVIVVGARCAGSPLAMLLARRGHRVLAVDRSSFPSDTISTHHIHQAGLSRLKSWGLLDRLQATGVTPMRHMNFACNGATISGSADPIEGITEVYSSRRTVPDSGLDWDFHHWTGAGHQQFGTWPTNDDQHVVAVMRRLERFAEFRADVKGNFQQIFGLEAVYDDADTPVGRPAYPARTPEQALVR